MNVSSGCDVCIEYTERAGHHDGDILGHPAYQSRCASSIVSHGTSSNPGVSVGHARLRLNCFRGKSFVTLPSVQQLLETDTIASTTSPLNLPHSPHTFQGSASAKTNKQTVRSNSTTTRFMTLNPDLQLLPRLQIFNHIHSSFATPTCTPLKAFALLLLLTPLILQSLTATSAQTRAA